MYVIFQYDGDTKIQRWGNHVECTFDIEAVALSIDLYSSEERGSAHTVRQYQPEPALTKFSLCCCQGRSYKSTRVSLLQSGGATSASCAKCTFAL